MRAMAFRMDLLSIIIIEYRHATHYIEAKVKNEHKVWYMYMKNGDGNNEKWNSLIVCVHGVLGFFLYTEINVTYVSSLTLSSTIVDVTNHMNVAGCCSFVHLSLFVSYILSLNAHRQCWLVDNFNRFRKICNTEHLLLDLVSFCGNFDTSWFGSPPTTVNDECILGIDSISYNFMS